MIFPTPRPINHPRPVINKHATIVMRIINRRLECEGECIILIKVGISTNIAQGIIIIAPNNAPSLGLDTLAIRQEAISPIRNPRICGRMKYPINIVKTIPTMIPKIVFLDFMFIIIF
jgi:hypothetical protein